MLMKNIEQISSRRNFLKHASTVSLAALGGMQLAGKASAMPVQTRATPADGLAHGMVFLDDNGSGKARGQRGLAGMLVSNGVDIVKTDDQGRYELAVTDDTIIFVIKPRNYATVVDDHQLPRFYYIHKPAGSPDSDFIYKGVAPTGALPESIDFPLYEKPEGDSLEVVLTADPQPYNLQHLKWYGEQAVREFAGIKADCGIALGDLVGDHLVLLDEYNRVNAQAGFPWHSVMGNHDLNFMAKEDRYAGETFQRIFGPATYAFQRGPVHFIVMNNIFWEGFTEMRRDGWPRRDQYFGHLRDWQLQFVRNYVQHVPKEDRIAICCHIPLINLPHYGVAHETPEFKELLQILSGHPHTMSFSGHTHINMNFFVGEEMGYNPPGGNKHHHFNLTSTSGSWYLGPFDHYGVPISHGRDGTPKGYAVLKFDGGEKYHIRFKGLGHPQDYQMNIALPNLVRSEMLGKTQVHVNVFNGSSETKVRMRVEGGSWISMESKMTVDPDYIALKERNDEHPEAGAGPLWDGFPTDHNWLAPLPKDLKEGWHKVDVEVINHFGESWADSRTFLVSSDAAGLEHLSQGIRTIRKA